MNEDFVSYEQAIKLKAAGFNLPCEAFYEHIGGKMWVSTDGKEDWNSGVDYSAPTLWQAQKWLREVHDWHIIVEPQAWDGITYQFKLYHKFRGYENANRGFDFSTYERALSAGITAALELIEKKGE